MASVLFGPAANMQYGTRAQRVQRQASAQEAKSLRRYGGLPFAEWVKGLDLPPNKLREKIRHRYDHEKHGRKATTLTYAEWLAENGITLPPLEPNTHAKNVHREAGLYINIKAAREVDEWIPWLLLIAAKRLPLNPAEVER